MERQGFRRSFLKLSAKRQYDLLSALRGPDERDRDGRDMLKAHITARIRAIVLFSAQQAAYRDRPMDRDDFHRVEETMKSISTSDHYIGHLREAVGSSLNHPIWGEHGRRLFSVLGG
jgi:hypothetical protein